MFLKRFSDKIQGLKSMFWQKYEFFIGKSKQNIGQLNMIIRVTSHFRLINKKDENKYRLEKNKRLYRMCAKMRETIEHMSKNFQKYKLQIRTHHQKQQKTIANTIAKNTILSTYFYYSKVCLFSKTVVNLQLLWIHLSYKIRQKE